MISKSKSKNNKREQSFAHLCKQLFVERSSKWNGRKRFQISVSARSNQHSEKEICQRKISSKRQGWNGKGFNFIGNKIISNQNPISGGSELAQKQWIETPFLNRDIGSSTMNW